VELEVCEADVVIGAVLLPGAAAPKLVTREMVRKMKAGAVVVDVAIDQGGCFETSKPTTHADPTFTVDGVLHYCVANMPGAVARTSTFALTNATYPFIEALANRGIVTALSQDHHLRNGLSVHRGNLTSEPVAQAQKVDFVSAEELLAV
jgi:alanine dehydrogenase